MSETKLTLDEAKACISQMISEWRAGDANFGGHGRFADGMQSALNILARVEQPSEDGMAVLWLLRRGWQIEYFDGGFGVWHDHPTDPAVFREINPTEEARKLGWKP